MAGDLEPAGRFTIRFDDDDAPGCRVESCDPPRGFAFRWPTGSVETRVEVSLTAAEGGTRLRLVHSRLGAARAPEYAAGWVIYLRRLGEDLAGDELSSWEGLWPSVRAEYRPE